MDYKTKKGNEIVKERKKERQKERKKAKRGEADVPCRPPVMHKNAFEMKSLSKEPQGSPYKVFSNKQALLSYLHWEICIYSLESERQ